MLKVYMLIVVLGLVGGVVVVWCCVCWCCPGACFFVSVGLVMRLLAHVIGVLLVFLVGVMMMMWSFFYYGLVLGGCLLLVHVLADVSSAVGLVVVVADDGQSVGVDILLVFRCSCTCAC